MENQTARCPHCNSTQIYYRVKTGTWQCTKCGEEVKKEEVKQ